MTNRGVPKGAAMAGSGSLSRRLLWPAALLALSTWPGTAPHACF
jgi:hypothetical protein